MKHTRFRNVLLASFLCAGLHSVAAQEGRSLKHIKVEKQQQTSLQKAPELLRQKLKMSQDETLQRVKQEIDDLGFTHEKFQQQFKGLKVEFATYTAHAKRGILRTMNGQFYDVNNLSIQPKISNEQAFQKALNHTKAEKYLWDYPEAAKAMDNYQKPEGELVILPKEVLRTKKAKLAYKFDIYATKPLSRGYLYIDANTGEALFYNAIIKHADKIGDLGKIKSLSKIDKKKMLESLFASGNAKTRYSGNRNIQTRKDGNVYTLNDETRKVYTRNAKNQDVNGFPYITNYDEFKDNDNNWTRAEHRTNKDDAALDAHWGTMKTYDYFKNKHNRNSFDDNGAPIRSYIHVRSNYDNAFWNGTVMSYGDGSSNGQEGNGRFDALTSIDISAHEIGHAICTNTAALVYQRESGAMNEGFSDIWGAAVEHFAKGNGNDRRPTASVWLIGDEVDRRSGISALRSMSNPNERKQPDTYGGTYWKDPNCPLPFGLNDYCGVHTNSGVLNYWFYLLTVGGSGTNDIGNSYSVSGIGMTKAAKIAYRLEANYLAPTSKFEDAREGAIIAASDLFGDGSSEVRAVINAWYAVGVGELCYLRAPQEFRVSNVGPREFTLDWARVSGARNYKLEITAVVSGIKSPGEIKVIGKSKIILGLQPGTEYRCKIQGNCTSGAGSPAIINVVTTGTPPIRYCPSKGRFPDEYIDRFQLGDIDNTSGSSTGYTYFSNLSTELTQGSTNTLTITPGFLDKQYEEGNGYGVWIDYNQDGDFSDANETIWTKAPSTESPVSTTFVIPDNAKPGPTRMRISMEYNRIPEACEADLGYGEAEDYKVIIKSANGDNQKPSRPKNLKASNITMSTATLSWTASTDNVGVVGYDVYQGTSLLTTTTNTTINVTGLSEQSPYTYSIRAKDASSNVSGVANIVFTTLSNENRPSAPVNLRASDITQNTVTLAWKASTDKNGGVITYEVFKSRTKIGTTTNTSFEVTGLQANKNYSFFVKATDPEGNTSNESNDLKVNTSNYCESKSKSSDEEWISYVSLANLKFRTGSVFGYGYGGYTHKSATVRKGRNYTLTIGIKYKNIRYRNRIVVWIDFNNNGVFDANEKVMSKVVSKTANYNQSIRIPANAKLGKTRMRVSAKRYINEQGPCGTFFRGEVEDYLVNITGNNTFTGITTDEENDSDEITIYPNPVSNFLNIKLNSNNTTSTYKIINIVGKVIQSGELNTTQLNITNLNSGLYILEVMNGMKVFKQKFIKK